jgi:hypothetical protein
VVFDGVGCPDRHVAGLQQGHGDSVSHRVEARELSPFRIDLPSRRIERTLFILSWRQSVELRRRVQVGLNIGEAAMP